MVALLATSTVGATAEASCADCDAPSCIAEGQALERLGRHSRARTCAERALSEAPDDLRGWWLLRRVLIEIGSDQELTAHLQAMRERVRDPMQRGRLEEEIRALGGEVPSEKPPAREEGSPWWYRFRALIGLAGILGLGWLMSLDRKSVQWRFVLTGVAVQLAIGVVLLRTPLGTNAFTVVRSFVGRVLAFSEQGIALVFGALGRPAGSPGHPFVIDAVSGDPVALGLVVAFHILPVLIFVGGLTGLLIHLKVVKVAVEGLTRVLARVLGSGGVESLVAVTNVFLGHVQAPLLVRPYLQTLSVQEIFTILTAGFATLASGVLAIYIQLGIDAGHLVTASVLSAPAALTMSQLVAPRPGIDVSHEGELASGDDNLIDAISNGTLAGLQIALSVAALLIAFVALIALVDWPLSALGTSLSEILGYLFLPIAWLIGIETADLLQVGSLLGTKIALNEFLAYTELLRIQDSLSPRSVTLATYALCGFACFSSVGVQVGSLGSLVPERRPEISRIAVRAMFAGALASSMTATIAGILL